MTKLGCFPAAKGKLAMDFGQLELLESYGADTLECDAGNSRAMSPT